MITVAPSVGSAVVRVNPIVEKLRKSPTSAVMAKLSPMENVALSIMSICSSFGNRVWVRQYPGKMATRTKPNAYLMYARAVSSGISSIEAKESRDRHMITQNQMLFFGAINSPKLFFVGELDCF
jgi:hypothetical protein